MASQVFWRRLVRGQACGKEPVKPKPQHAQHGYHIDVRRNGEDVAGFANAPQVHHRHQGNDYHRDHDTGFESCWEGRRNGFNSSRHRHSDGQDVVGEKRGGSDEPGHCAQVLEGNHVAAAAVGVGKDHLPVADDDDRQDGDDGQRERHRERQRANTGKDKHAHDLFGRVCRRRDVVGGEDRQALEPAGALFSLLLRGDSLADKYALDTGHELPEAAPRCMRLRRRFQEPLVYEPELCFGVPHAAHIAGARPGSRPVLALL